MTAFDTPKPAELGLRLANVSDVGSLVDLMRDFYLESGFPLDEPWAKESFRQLLANPDLGRIWVVHCGPEPVGHVVLTVRYTMEFGGLSGYIDDLYVRPTFRRRYAGRKLLAALVAECRARGCKSLQVEVGEFNVAALALYSQFGLKAATDGRLLLSGALAEERA